MFRFFLAVILSLTISTQIFAGKKEDIAAFKKAYTDYQAALAGNNNTALYFAAKKAYEIGLKAFGDTHTNTANLALNYAQAANGAGKKDDAQKAINTAEKLYKSIYGEDSREMVDIYIEKAKANLEVFEDRRAGKRYYNKALKLAQKHYEKDSLLEGVIRSEIGEILLYDAQAKEAISHFRKAAKILEQHGEVAKTYLARTNFSTGKYYLADKKHKKATKALNASLSVYEELAPSAQVTLANHAILIRAYEEQGLSEKATEHCRAIGAASPQDPNQDYKPVYFSNPIYPRSAQSAGSEGYTIVELTVDADGFVKNPKIIESKGTTAFHKASIEAAKKFRYAPRFENGEAVATDGVKYRFSFKLTG